MSRNSSSARARADPVVASGSGVPATPVKTRSGRARLLRRHPLRKSFAREARLGVPSRGRRSTPARSGPTPAGPLCRRFSQPPIARGTPPRGRRRPGPQCYVTKRRRVCPPPLSLERPRGVTARGAYLFAGAPERGTGTPEQGAGANGVWTARRAVKMTGTSAGFSAQVHRGSRRGRRFQWDDSRRTKQAQVDVVWGRGQAILDRVNRSSFARTALPFTAAAEDKQVPTENKIKRCRGTQQRVALGGRCGRRQPMVPRLPRRHGRKPIRRPTRRPYKQPKGVGTGRCGGRRHGYSARPSIPRAASRRAWGCLGPFGRVRCWSAGRSGRRCSAIRWRDCFWTCAGWSCAALPPTPTSSPHSETTRARSFSATPNFPLLRFAYPAADGEMGVDEELTLLLGGRLRVRLTAAFSLGRRLPRREVWAMVRLPSWRSSSMILHCRGEAAARLRPT
eukprot:TRINITY_DN97_c0_g1_i2.p1 TRINITY_DN97_c0_g1~~TRINITY_DN97_c0_g1_i2.p1  ORF type:complete len:450 (+),score=-87.21 TRINITY_DN97_c0_g1_i2:1547-2896(+)